MAQYTSGSASVGELNTVIRQITIDKDRRLVTTRLSGRFSDADLETLHHQLEGNPDFDPHFDRICDLSEVTDVALTKDEVKKWAAHPALERSARHAVVCSQPAVMKHALDFVTESRQNLRQVLIFPSCRDAANWINLGKPKAEN